MTQQPDETADGTLAERAADADAPETTGVAAVDEVLASLDGLDGAPVSEHVAVFEAAHERLRAALTDAGDARS